MPFILYTHVRRVLYIYTVLTYCEMSIIRYDLNIRILMDIVIEYGLDEYKMITYSDQ